MCCAVFDEMECGAPIVCLVCLPEEKDVEWRLSDFVRTVEGMLDC